MPGILPKLAMFAPEALLPNVHDPKHKGEFSTARSNQRRREATAGRAVVVVQMAVLFLCSCVGMVARHALDRRVDFIWLMSLLEPVALGTWLVVLVLSPLMRYWSTLCMLIQVWMTTVTLRLVYVMLGDECAGVAQHSGIAERVCEYTGAGLYPSWISAIILALNCVINILDRFSFRTKLTVLFIQYTACAVAIWGMLDASAASPTYYGRATNIWHDFITAILLQISFEREQRYDFLESLAKEQQVEEEKMLAALLCHEIKNPLTVVDFFLSVVQKEQQQQQQQQLQLQLQIGDGGIAAATQAEAGAAATNSLHWALKEQARLVQAAEGGAVASKFQARQRALLQLLPDAIHCCTVMVDLVENCRHLAKVDSGTYVPVEDEISMRQLAESCLGIFGREREAGLVFDLQCSPELTIVSDGLLWRHVLMYLVGNAVKFTMHKDLSGPSAPPRVKVRIHRDGYEVGRLRVEVSDNGPGIDRADQAFIFGQFSQATHGFRAPQGLSSGLGLHLSAKIVQMLKGKLDLVSPLEADGRGTRFDISVPVMFAEVAVAKAEAKMPFQHDAPPLVLTSVPSHLRFLLIEDDDLNCMILRTSIEAGFHGLSGATVTTTHAKNAEEALGLLGDGPMCAYDVVVCDQHMETSGGVMKGTEFISALHKMYCQSRAPVVVLASGNTDEADIEHYHACGADVVWSKPYPSAPTLVGDVVAQLHKRQSPPPAQQRKVVGPAESEQQTLERDGSLRNFFRVFSVLVPAVPMEYCASRRKTTATRDVGLVRAIAVVDIVMRTAASVAHFEDGKWTHMIGLVLPFVILAVMWAPERWERGSYMGAALLCGNYVYSFSEAAGGYCNDPTEMTANCIAHRAHLAEPGAIGMFYTTNVLISFCGGLPFSVHMKSALVEGTLIVAGVLLNGVDLSTLLDTVWMIGTFFGIMCCVERKRRCHYLDSTAKEQLAEQQKKLVTLLWCVPFLWAC
jgi:signal transduction histidine kinase/CheY-like chemotaxis protein